MMEYILLFDAVSTSCNRPKGSNYPIDCFQIVNKPEHG